jgi:hypothetical protein
VDIGRAIQVRYTPNMAWRHVVVLVAVLGASETLVAQTAGRAGARGATRVSRTATCAFDLGTGVRSKLRFCDVVIAEAGTGSIAMTIPAHTGPATLLFDLHPRVQLVSGVVDPLEAFARNSAVVAIVRSSGDVIDRVAIMAEYRAPADLFDRIAGAGPDGFKAVAPGKPEAVRVTIPAGVTAIGIVGVRVEIMKVKPTPLRAAFDAPGRPVAIASNLRVEYR